ncbi:LHFPL tetraspan subfamily member 3 protein-like [Artemia franciscana]|uniref:Uncharacterized protein n=1 Tax=Artemia franciscana TaxID=6661 RepID=A0AA88L4F7_ARTSF|nr:hypothetical protein QYM36_005705 [Artemia franciscana]
MSIAESEKQSWYFITKKYVRKIRAIRIIWAICVLVVIAVQIICFTSPYWVVNVKGPVIGYFGLWKTCRAFSGDFKCQGRLDDFANLLNVSAKAVTALYGLGVLILIGGALIMGFFAFLRASKVLRACAWMICLSGILSATVLIVFPSIWDDTAIKLICGPDSRAYKLGSCEVKWPFFLACMNTLATFVTSILAFTMADRFVAVEDEYLYRTQIGPSPFSHGIINGAFPAPSNQTAANLALAYSDRLPRRTPSSTEPRNDSSRHSPFKSGHMIRTSYAPSSVYA